MRWTKDACIEGLRVAAVDGVVSSRMAERSATSLPTMASRHFGSFAEACRAAGLRSVTDAKVRYEKCSAPDCSDRVRSVGTPYCEMHYGRLRRSGTLGLRHVPDRRGHSHGYVLLYAPNHALRRASHPYVYEHRVVYHDVHGDGPFRCHWCAAEVTWDMMHIDHVNGVKDDNQPGNLVASCAICNQQRGKEKMRRTMCERHGVWLEFNGERRILKDWARLLGITDVSLRGRLVRGWPLERALTEPRGQAGPRAGTRSPILEKSSTLAR